MNTHIDAPTNRENMGKHATRSVTSGLHPRVYAVLIAFALWFALWVWSFAGVGVTDYLLVIVSGFIFVVVALTLILSRVGHKDPAMGAREAKADDGQESFHDWAVSDFDTCQGRLSGLEAATLILLPIAAAAVGMMAFGIVFLVVEHGV